MMRTLRRMRDIQIKKQLVLLVLISVLVIIVIQAMYISDFTHTTERQSLSYFSSISEQIASDLSMKLKEITAASNMLAYSDTIQKYLTAEDSYTRFQLLNAAKDNMNYSIASNSAIDSITIYQTDSTSFLSYGIDRKERMFSEIYKAYRLVPTQKLDPFFTSAFWDVYTKGYFFAYVHPIYSVREGYGNIEPIGMMMTLCTANVFHGLGDLNHMTDMGLYIADDKNILASNGQERPSYLPIQGGDGGQAGEQHHIATPDGTILIKRTSMLGTAFTLYCTVPLASLTSSVRPIISKSLILSLCGLCMLVALGVLVASNIISPIHKMIEEMRLVGEGPSSARIARHADNEVGIISDDINHMLAKIERMNLSILGAQRQLYESELARAQSELSYLYSQINPHFLYNSLDCIRSIALINKQPEIMNMSVALSRILRYAVQAENMVTIRAELDLAKDYHSVINIRYMNIYTLQIMVDPILLDNLVIKMLLQPIVENSMNYGLKARRKDGLVRIQAFEPEGSGALVLKVFDNGKGMNADMISALNRKLSDWRSSPSDQKIGLINIQRRIKLTYGEDYGLRIVSHVDWGTCVLIRLPIQKN